MENLDSFPRRGYVQTETPLEELHAFSRLLGVRVRCKRDDLLPLGGSKIRKFDYLMEQAVEEGADTIVTASTNQCCHNSLLALLAGREGMRCRLIMESWGDPDYRFETAPNRKFFSLCGADEIAVVPDVPAGPVESMPAAKQMAEAVRQAGGRPYFMPRGGSAPLGNLGYVRCALEIAAQCGRDLPSAVLCPCGIGGTQAGLVVGFRMLGLDVPVLGVGVTGKRAREMEDSVARQCGELTDLLGEEPVGREEVRCLDGYAGDGYGRASAEQERVMGLLARSEGILTDPVYSGKTLLGLEGVARSRQYAGEGGLLFLHTGGLQLFYDFSCLEERGERG
jgi:D-cysteine desulfhydrase